MSASTLSSTTTQAWLPEGEISAISNAPDWHRDYQSNALALYQAHGLPGVRDEEWRYTNLRKLKATNLSFARPLADTPDLTSGTNNRLVFINGFFNPGLSNLQALPDGVVCTNLAAALTEHSDELRAIFGQSLPEQQHGFQLLNSAAHSDGYVVLIPDNLVVDAAIEVVFYQSSNQAAQTRNLVVAGANSRCTLIERHTGVSDSCYLNNAISELFTRSGACIGHYKLQQESNQAFHVGGVYLQQERDSKIQTHNLSLSGGLLRNDIIASLNGPGAHVEMNGLVMGSDNQHIDNHTEVLHQEPHCTSDEFYKTILDDASRSVFRGRIVVAQDAQQTNADQQNNNLLLSAEAEADTKPQLEIYADDVKCSHGATVGQLEDSSVFYLQSRGINKTAARALLTFAFANEIIERIQVEDIRDEITQLIAGELISDLEDVL